MGFPFSKEGKKAFEKDVEAIKKKNKPSKRKRSVRSRSSRFKRATSRILRARIRRR